MKKFICLTLLALTSCFQKISEDDDFRTVPVTNNPNIVPNYGNGLPGMGGGSPY